MLFVTACSIMMVSGHSPFQAMTRFACLTALLCGVVVSQARAMQLREWAREYARNYPGEPMPHPPAPPWDWPWPKPLEELAREADVVLQAKLVRIGSYIAPSGDRLLTDYSMQDQQVIAGRLPVLATPTPGAAVPLILTVWGGEAVVEGVLVRGTDQNFEAIKEGGLYFLFLRPSRRAEPGRYEIHYGGIFELVQDTLKPLYKGGDAVFKDAAGAPLRDLLPRIQKAAPFR